MTRLRTLSLALVVLGGGLLAVGIVQSGHGQPAPPFHQAHHSARHRSKPTNQPVSVSAPARTVPAATPRLSPESISISGIGVSSALGPARGLNPDGTVNDAPLSGPTWSLPWWYDGGPSPGQDGSAVILGHVDSAVGVGHLGVFYRLGDVQPGTSVTVTATDGEVTHWVVASTVLYPDQAFPDAVVYDPTGPPTLRLVTCGGAFDPQTHSYQSAVVVTARPV